jgi:hypothetical protein
VPSDVESREERRAKQADVEREREAQRHATNTASEFPLGDMGVVASEGQKSDRPNAFDGWKKTEGGIGGLASKYGMQNSAAAVRVHTHTIAAY